MNEPWQGKLVDLAMVTIPAAIAVLGTLTATRIANRHAAERTKVSKALDFAERRVLEFYSPMVGSVHRMRALTSLRYEISAAAGTAWHDICERAPRPFEGHEKAFEPFKRIIEYENEQLYDEILPVYDKMVATFTENYWLADSETQAHYADLCRFVEIWHRFKADAIPYEVHVALDHSEAPLTKLYALLERKLAEYTAQVENRAANTVGTKGA